MEICWRLRAPAVPRPRLPCRPFAWSERRRPGQVNNAVQSSAVPYCAPAIEYVAMPEGSSSAAPATIPGPGFSQSTDARQTEAFHVFPDAAECDERRSQKTQSTPSTGDMRRIRNTAISATSTHCRKQAFRVTPSEAQIRKKDVRTATCNVAGNTRAFSVLSDHRASSDDLKTPAPPRLNCCISFTRIPPSSAKRWHRCARRTSPKACVICPPTLPQK